MAKRIYSKIFNNSYCKILMESSPGNINKLHEILSTFAALKIPLPSKFSSQRYNQPWVTTKTKQICRRKKHLYRRAHISDRHQDWIAYYNIKKLAQYECQKAHNEYVSKLVGHNINHPCKKLWSYVTKFAKRGLIHAFNFSTLRMCNSASVGPTALKFRGRPFLSLY